MNLFVNIFSNPHLSGAPEVIPEAMQYEFEEYKSGVISCKVKSQIPVKLQLYREETMIQEMESKYEMNHKYLFKISLIIFLIYFPDKVTILNSKLNEFQCLMQETTHAKEQMKKVSMKVKLSLFWVTNYTKSY